MSYRHLLVGSAAFIFVACATISARRLPAQVTIKLAGQPGSKTVTRYYSASHILNFENNQLVRERNESVAFKVETDVVDVEPKGGLIQFSEKTIEKDGTDSLHDLGFPELNEQIDYVIRENGEVLKAGNFPSTSLFFVPSFPIPSGPVKVGDTWSLSHTWYSAKESIPLHLQVIGILKGIVTCEKTKICADVELSGDVSLVKAPTVQGADYSSHLWGRMLFSLSRGDALWSEMRSREAIHTPHNSMKVSSCMVSEMNIDGHYTTKNDCNPDQKDVSREVQPK